MRQQNLNKLYMLNVSFLNLKEGQFKIKPLKYWLEVLQITEEEFNELVKKAYFRYTFLCFFIKYLKFKK